MSFLSPPPQEHHTARDVFLTELRAEEELDCLLRPVAVCAPSQLDQQPQGDVFVCDHQYHTGCAVSPPALQLARPRA